MPFQTPSQTVGPFFSHALTASRADSRTIAGNGLADEDTPGEAIRIEGTIIDGAGDRVPDAMLEIWQADSDGLYPDGGGCFVGFGRAGTDAAGAYWFRTIKPGPVATGSAPHINLAVFARGMLNHAFTRIYFSDEEEANAGDTVLASVDPPRRKTLIARKRDTFSPPTHEFTIRLQGDEETVFFDV